MQFLSKTFFLSVLGIWVCKYFNVQKGKALGVQFLLQWWPRRDHVNVLYYCHSRPCAVPKQYRREHCRETCRDSDYSIWLASRFVRAPNSRSGGHEFETPMWREFGALTKSGKTLGVRSFYNIYFLVSRPGCVSLLHYFSRFYNFFSTTAAFPSLILCTRPYTRVH